MVPVYLPDSHGSAITRDTHDHPSPPAKRRKGDSEGGGDDNSGCYGNNHDNPKERDSSEAEDFGDKDDLKKLFINVSDGGRELFIDTGEKKFQFGICPIWP